jgi:hypothetical protein
VAPFHALGANAPFLPRRLVAPLPVPRDHQKAAHTAPTEGPPGRMGGERRQVRAGSVSGFRLRGVRFRTAEGLMSPPQDRIVKIRYLVRQWHRRSSVSAREFLLLLGLLNSAADQVPSGGLHSSSPLTVAPPVGPTRPVGPGPGGPLGAGLEFLAVLNKVASSRVRLCLIAPCWPNQAWCPVLLELLTDHPRGLPEWDRLLWHPIRKVFHQTPLSSSFTLGDRLSGISSEREAFRQTLSRKCLGREGVDPCFLRQQVVRLQRLVRETRVFSGLSHSTPVPRLLEFPFL